MSAVLFTLVIREEDLRIRKRKPPCGQVFRDRKKYTRKEKHKGRCRDTAASLFSRKNQQHSFLAKRDSRPRRVAVLFWERGGLFLGKRMARRGLTGTSLPGKKMPAEQQNSAGMSQIGGGTLPAVSTHG